MRGSSDSPVRLRGEEGAAAVEFAIVSMLLIMLLVGIIQFAFLFNQWQQIEHASREGARWASLGNVASQVRSVVKAAAPGIAIADSDITVNPADPSTAAPGTATTVQVSVIVPVFTPIMSQFLGANVPLTATATQRVE